MLNREITNNIIRRNRGPGERSVILNDVFLMKLTCEQRFRGRGVRLKDIWRRIPDIKKELDPRSKFGSVSGVFKDQPGSQCGRNRAIREENHKI